MKALSHVILVKMVLTVLLWFLPLLFAPISFLQDQCAARDLAPVAVFIRLLGMAYGALLVGYGFGYAAARRHDYPKGVVWTGIVSNGGAFLLLWIYRDSWMAWKSLTCGLMWASLAATGLISAFLIALGPCQRHNSSPPILKKL